MAKLNQPRTCAYCGLPVKQGSNFLRAHLWGAVVLVHWRCFRALMRASERKVS
jgi:hypothetical protein